MMILKAAAIQTVSGADREANLRQAEALLQEAVAKGAQLVSFPENLTLMTDSREAKMAGAETEKGPSLPIFKGWAKTHGIWLHTGSMPLRAEGGGKAAPRGKGRAAALPKRVTNTSFLIGPDGRVKARYDKIHLFDADVHGDRPYRESDTVAPGKKPVRVATPWGGAGLTVCYDLRFPELYRDLAKKGASVIFIPAAFTVPTGEAHWDLLTRARAVENQAYVIAAGQGGEHPGGRKTYGHSRIIDPWGRILAERVEPGPGVVLADLDFDALAKIRRDLPALQHRRL